MKRTDAHWDDGREMLGEERKTPEARLIAAAVAVVEAAKENYRLADLAPQWSGPFMALVEAVDAWKLEQ